MVKSIWVITDSAELVMAYFDKAEAEQCVLHLGRPTVQLIEAGLWISDSDLPFVIDQAEIG